IKAIAWLQEGNIPDLILSDIYMPNMSGIDFLDYIKKNDLFKSIPFVILSSEDSTSQKIELLEKGADDYISKPFNPIELKVRLKKLFRDSLYDIYRYK
ncbi:MAG: response regulator, partial [Bacteroidales bacterium]